MGLLGVTFVVLKLTGVIDWSWWWVTVPFWGVLAIVLVIIISISLVSLAIEVFDRGQKKSRRQ